jgi:hypothetical protein
MRRRKRRLASVLAAPLLWRLAFLRRTAGPCHHGPVLFDELARIGRSVVIALHASTRVALSIESMNLALLLVGPVLFTAP